MLTEYGFTPSMSRRGNCCGNACSETLFGSLRVESLYKQRFETRRRAKDEVIAWLFWCNQTRLHSTLPVIRFGALPGAAENAASYANAPIQAAPTVQGLGVAFCSEHGLATHFHKRLLRFCDTHFALDCSCTSVRIDTEGVCSGWLAPLCW